jgi:hypothetical protein
VSSGITSVYPKFSQELEAGMAYAERRESSKGARYRGFYNDADGRYKSAGTHGTEARALEVAREAEKRATALISGATGGLDPVIRSTRTIEEYVPVSCGTTGSRGTRRTPIRACCGCTSSRSWARSGWWRQTGARPGTTSRRWRSRGGRRTRDPARQPVTRRLTSVVSAKCHS